MDTINAYNRGLMERAESNMRIAQLFGITVGEWRARIDNGEVKDELLLAYIHGLRKKYKTALLSNIGRQSLERRFSAEELRTNFDTVVISGDLGVVKPEQGIYLRAAEQLGVAPSECVMVDDRETHCAGARAVGMQTIMYQDFVQAKQDLAQLLGTG